MIRDKNSEKLYYYCFSFKGLTPNGSNADASSYAGYESQPFFTFKEIDKQKINSGLTVGAVLLSITFLGVMTKEEFMS